MTENSIDPIRRAVRLPSERVSELGRDIRYGLRMLARSKGFTAVALISLTLGIGVATSAFSEMNGFVLRDVPQVAQPGELVMLQAPVSYPGYRRYRELPGLFSGTLAYMAPVPLGVWLNGRTERVWGHLVTPSYFSTLGVRPLLGRVFDEHNEQPGQAPTAVISYRFWQEHLGGDPAVVGSTLRVNGHPATVIGVGPKDFLGASPMVYAADLWLPIWMDPAVAPELANNVLERRDRTAFHVLARLRPGVPAARAEAALDAVARQMERESGDPDRGLGGRRVTLLPGGKLLPIRKQDLPMLTGFFALLGGMILLIASSNVANMMLARAADRRREIAVRLALGAGRGRLVRQLLTESMLVAAGAGVLGFLMAMLVMRGAAHEKLPWPMPLTFNLTPDGRVLLFTLALTAFTGLAFGLLPALRATRTDLTPALKEGGDVRLRRYRRLSLRNLLMLAQVAASLALLLITGFLVLGHRRMVGGDVGFDARNLSMISLDPVRDGYSGERAIALLPKLLDRVQALPSVTAASLADTVPMQMIGKPPVNFTVAGTDAGTKAIPSAHQFVVGKDFFRTIGIPILRGRSFRQQDEASDSMAVVVNERLAEYCWPGQDPLGQRIEVADAAIPGFQLPSKSPAARPRLGKTRVFAVVGVARNVRDGLVMSAKDVPLVIYLPLRPADYAQPALQGITLMVRTAPGVDAIGILRREIGAIDTRLTPFNPRSMAQQIDELMFPVWVALYTYGFIGVFGLILASVGLAGVTAYSVTQRRREIGIRVALGASRADILGLVMKQGAVLVAVGTVIGMLLARGGTRVLSAILSDVARTAGTSTSDPLLLIGAPLLLAALAMLACFIPARQSMRIDPVVALRQE